MAIYYGTYPGVENLRSLGNDLTNTTGEAVYGGIDSMDKHSWTIIGNSANNTSDATQQFVNGTMQVASVLPSRRTSGTTTVMDADTYFTEYPNQNGWLGEYWQYGGTLGTLSGVTGSIAAGKNQLTVNTTAGLSKSMCLTIAGMAGSYCIAGIDYTRKLLTLAAHAGATVSNAASIS